MFHKHIYRYREHKTIGVDFSAGRFLRRYSFIYLLQFSIPIRYYAMAIQYMNTFSTEGKLHYPIIYYICLLYTSDAADEL